MFNLIHEGCLLVVWQPRVPVKVPVSVLALRPRLLDAQTCGYRGFASIGPVSQRRGVLGVEAGGDADIAVVRADIMHGVEADPAETGRVSLGPGEHLLAGLADMIALHEA